MTAISSNSPSQPETAEPTRSLKYWWPEAVVLAAHAVIAFTILPPARLFDGVPLLLGDYAYHWHIAHISHQALQQGDLPWGCNPRVLPGQWHDLSSGHNVPYQAFGVLFGPTVAVKLLLVGSVLLAPVCVLAGCWAFGFRREYRVWVLLATTLALWMTHANVFMIRCGLMAFFPAAYLAFPTLGLFTRFADSPSWGRWAAFLAAASAMFAFHSFSPLAILIPLVVVILTSPQLGIKWRLVAVASPIAIAIANFWWVIPNFGFAFLGSRPDWESIHPMIHQGNMTFKSWGEFVAFITKPHQLVANAAALVLFAYGTMRAIPSTRRASRIGLISAVLGLLVIYWFGSFLGPLKVFQTNRFGMPFRLFLLATAAPAFAILLQKLRLPPRPVAALIAVGAAGFLLLTGRVPETPVMPHQDELTDWIRTHTTPEDRIVLQAVDEDCQALAIAGYLDRELLSTGYPNLLDPVQFTATPATIPEMAEVFLGKKLTDWTPAELRAAFDRFGISVMIVRSEGWAALLESLPVSPTGQLGPYKMYRVSDAGERFLVGRGRVRVSVNRLELTDLVPENGRVVIKYRYHPGWSSTESLDLSRHTIPDDRYGFIELKNPPSTVTLRFNPWRSLFAPWPPSRSEN